MCTGNIMEFGYKVINAELVSNKNVLEVGAYNVNGTLKDKIMEFNPKTYVGVDIREGPNVDLVCDIGDLDFVFDSESFDLVVCTEVLEHVKDWPRAIQNLKTVVAPGGVILITVPTVGFPYHEYPSDYWRFTLDNLRSIFSDFDWVAWHQHSDPGVCILVRKPLGYVHQSMITPNIEEAK